MEPIYIFFQTHIIIVYFIYGLVFFMMGFAIALQREKSSSLILARSFNYLAAFGIIHGLSEWGHVFIPIMELYSSELTINTLYFIEVNLIGISFVLLLLFGIKLCIDTFGFPAKIIWVPRIGGIAWILVFTLYPYLAQRDDLGHWYLLGDVFSRYAFAFPGSLLSAYAFWHQQGDLSSLEQPHMLRHAKRVSSLFILYALFAGLIVPQAPLFPASWLNIQNLFRFTGIPVAVYRAVICSLIAYFVIRLTAIFNIESIKQLSEARQDFAVMRERQRIRRDLHDGILQSIFAVGLGLESAKHVALRNPQQAVDMITMESKRLDSINHEIRHYIMDIQQTSYRDKSLKEIVLGAVEEFKLRSGMQVDLHLKDSHHEKFDFIHKEQLYLIVQELLSNIIKHSQAGKVSVSLLFFPNHLALEIADNGVGMPTQKLRSGLQNILERAESINADVVIESERNQGTTVQIKAPYQISME